VVRTLVIVVLVLVAGVLAVLLLSALMMAWMMGMGVMDGMMNGMMSADSQGAMSSAGLTLALVVLVTIRCRCGADLGSALPTPPDEESSKLEGLVAEISSRIFGGLTEPKHDYLRAPIRPRLPIPDGLFLRCPHKRIST
jgi:hypothetical protein